MAPLVTLAACATGATHAAGRAPGWTVHAIAPTSRYEAAGVADFDRDGVLDVFSGEAWYAGPTWTRHQVRTIPPGPNPHYLEDFGDLPLDVNGDGRVDIVTCTYFTKTIAWIENPLDARAPWIEHVIDRPGPSEACRLIDLDGDGDLDILPNTVNETVIYTFDKGAFTRNALGPGGHGVGAGDVDGDGRIDVIAPGGWFTLAPTPVFHPEFELGQASIPIVARDVNGDGLTDLIWGQGHGFGIEVAFQLRAAEGGRRWRRQFIDQSFSQVHALALTDLGDGPVLVTGKRIYAHEIEPGATDAPVIVSMKLLAGGGVDKQVLVQGIPARKAPADAVARDAMRDFAPGSVGTGLDIVPADLDGDGDVDLVCPGKTGLYWLENPGRGKTL